MIDLSTQRFALYALLAAALFGVSAPLAKALGAHVSPVWLASLLYLGSGLALGLWRSARRAQAGDQAAGAALTRADMPWLAGSVLAGGVAGPLALMWGLRSISGSSASLLLSLEGLLTTLLAALVFREAVTARVWLAACLMLIASVLLARPDGSPAGIVGSLAVVLAYVAGFFVMLAVMGWHPTPKRVPAAQTAPHSSVTPLALLPAAGPGRDLDAGLNPGNGCATISSLPT